jgi:hypothetical protein
MAASPVAQMRTHRRILIASLIGTSVEFYDFYLRGADWLLPKPRHPSESWDLLEERADPASQRSQPSLG